MDITDDGDRCIDVDDVGFAHEDLLCLFAYFAEEGLVEELLSEELFDAGVEIKRSHCKRR
jgi:hypothetical protein